MDEDDVILQEDLRLLYENLDVTFALLSLVAYEFLVTVDQEMFCVWKKKLTATSLLLLATRWLMVLGPLVGSVLWPLDWCRPVVTLTAVLYFMTLTVIAAVYALRIYALWQGTSFKWIFAALVFALSFVPVATNIFAQVHTVTEVDSIGPLLNCNAWINAPAKLNEELLYLTRSSAIAADVLALVLTWAKSFQQFRQMRRLGLHSSVATILLRDGTLYFVALLAMNILLLITFTASGLSVGGAIGAALQYMPPVLVQRFMLNLR